MIDLLPDSDQQQVVDSVAGYLARELPLKRLRPGVGKQGAERRRWSELAELGWFGLGLPEEVDGAGFTAVEEMLAHREFGRFLVSPSVIATAVAAHLAFAAGDKDLSAALVRGKVRASAAAAFHGATVGQTVDGQFHLFDSIDGDLVLLFGPSGTALVERSEFMSVCPAVGLDESVALESAAARAATARVFVPEASAAVRRRAHLLIAATLVGMAESTRDLAVEYAGMRTQFGKIIGSFQGIAHHCADMELRTSAARAQVSFAAIAERDGRSHAAFQVAAAGLTAADAALKNAPIAIRVHGAMGFTAECELHLYLKRAHLLERLMGGARSLQTMLMAEPAPDLSSRPASAER